MERVFKAKGQKSMKESLGLILLVLRATYRVDIKWRIAHCRILSQEQAIPADLIANPENTQRDKENGDGKIKFKLATLTKYSTTTQHIRLLLH